MEPVKRILRSGLTAAADRIASVPACASALDRRYGGLGFSLLFHSIVSSPRDYLFQNMKHSAAGLERLLRYCRKADIDVVSMDAALERLAEARPGRFVVFTFDDGYRDNLTRVLPIFEKYGAPFTVYITTGIVKRNLYYWWAGLLELVLRNECIDVDGLEKRFRTFSFRGKRVALHRITEWVAADIPRRCELLRPAFARHNIDPLQLLDRDGLSHSDVRRLARSPLVTIGGHTQTHRPLAALQPDEAIREIIDNRNFLEDLIQKDVRHFAFPHGDDSSCGEREANLLRSTGFRSGFSTRRGNLFPEHAAAPFLLPRGFINPRRETEQSFRALKVGAHRWLESRGGSPVNPEALLVRADGR